MWDGESELKKCSSVCIGNVESGHQGAKTIKVHNKGGVLIHYTARMSQSWFDLSSTSGQIQSGQVLSIRIRYRLKSPQKDPVADTLKLCFNNDDTWPLKVSASCGEMGVALIRGRDLAFALDLCENTTLNKTCSEKELKVELCNTGNIPVRVELQPHPLVKAVGDAKRVIDKGQTIEFFVTLDSFPPRLATSSPPYTMAHYKINSKEQRTIQVPFLVNIRKAGIEVKPVGHIDLDFQPTEQELDQHWLTVSNVGKNKLVYSMNAKTLQGSGKLVVMRDKNPRTEVTFGKERKIKTARDSSVNRFILRIEAEECF